MMDETYYLFHSDHAYPINILHLRQGSDDERLKSNQQFGIRYLTQKLL